MRIFNQNAGVKKHLPAMLGEINVASVDDASHASAKSVTDFNALPPDVVRLVADKLRPQEIAALQTVNRKAQLVLNGRADVEEAQNLHSLLQPLRTKKTQDTFGLSGNFTESSLSKVAPLLNTRVRRGLLGSLEKTGNKVFNDAGGFRRRGKADQQFANELPKYLGVIRYASAAERKNIIARAGRVGSRDARARVLDSFARIWPALKPRERATLSKLQENPSAHEANPFSPRSAAAELIEKHTAEKFEKLMQSDFTRKNNVDVAATLIESILPNVSAERQLAFLDKLEQHVAPRACFSFVKSWFAKKNVNLSETVRGRLSNQFSAQLGNDHAVERSAEFLPMVSDAARQKFMECFLSRPDAIEGDEDILRAVSRNLDAFSAPQRARLLTYFDHRPASETRASVLSEIARKLPSYTAAERAVIVPAIIGLPDVQHKGVALGALAQHCKVLEPELRAQVLSSIKNISAPYQRILAMSGFKKSFADLSIDERKAVIDVVKRFGPAYNRETSDILAPHLADKATIDADTRSAVVRAQTLAGGTDQAERIAALGPSIGALNGTERSRIRSKIATLEQMYQVLNVYDALGPAVLRL